MSVASPFHDTLWQATQEVFKLVEEYKVELTEDSVAKINETYLYGMRYNEVLRCDVPIEKMKGRNTRKWLNVILALYGLTGGIQ